MGSAKSEVLSPKSKVRFLDSGRRTSDFGLVLTLILLAGCATTAGRKSPIDLAVDAASQRCRCRMGIDARHLESGRSYGRNGEAEFEAASLVKIAILTEALAERSEGRIDLTERWTLTDAAKADGSGTLLILDAGLNPTWNDLITLMIGPSDNTATNAWIRRFGIDNINARMDHLGFRHIRLLTVLPSYPPGPDGPSPWSGLHFGIVTPREVGEWMVRVGRGELIDKDSSQRIFEYLDKDPTRQRIARRFPSEYLWAGKSGSMSGVRNDAGILRTKKGSFVIVVLTDGGSTQSVSSADHPSVLAIADVAKSIVDTWSRDLPDVTDKPK
jgi:beta-lactamase class A